MAEARIDFRVGGIAEVAKALATVQQAMDRTERARMGGIARETRTTERAKQSEVRAAEKAEREIERARARGASSARRERDQISREMEREERSKTASAARWVRQREREEIASARRVAAQRRRMAETLTGAAGRGFRSGVSTVGGVASRAAGVVMGLGGGFSLGDSIERSTRISGTAADIANSGFIPGGQNAANRTKRSTGEIVGAARGAAVQYGLSTESVLGGLQEFVGKSGDLDTGLKTMGQLAELSRATGASFTDVAGAAGDLMSQLGDMPNKSEAVMTIMRGIAAQGKLGAVEMRDLASQMAKLAASAGQFGGNAVDNILKMGMLAQEARAGGGAASATMAATSVTGFVNTLKTPARISEFKAAGVNLRDDKNLLRDPQEIIIESLKATKGDPERMKKLFANVMGERAVQGFTNRFNQAGGGAAGEKAVRGRMAELMNGATMSKADVAKAASDRMREDDAKIARAKEELDQAISRDLVPEFMKLVPVIKDTTPAFISLMRDGVPAFVQLIKSVSELATSLSESSIGKMLAQHPIGAIIAAFLIKDLASAGIGIAVKAALTTLMSGGGVASGAAGAAGGLGKSVPLLAAGAAAGASVYGAVGTYDQAGQDVAAGGAEATGAVASLGAMSKKIRSGQATPEEIAQFQTKANSIQRMVAQAQGTETGGLTRFGVGVAATAERGASIFGYSGTGAQDAQKGITRDTTLKENLGAIETSLMNFKRALDSASGSAQDPARSRPMVSFERGGTER